MGNSSSHILIYPFLGVLFSTVFGVLFVITDYELHKNNTSFYETDPVLFATLMISFLIGFVIYLTGMTYYKTDRIYNRIFLNEKPKKLSKKQERLITIPLIIVLSIAIFFMYDAGYFDSIIGLVQPITEGEFTI